MGYQGVKINTKNIQKCLASTFKMFDLKISTHVGHIHIYRICRNFFEDKIIKVKPLMKHFMDILHTLVLLFKYPFSNDCSIRVS